ALNHFGVASDDSHTCLLCCCRHRCNDAAQIGDWEALLQDKACREVERLRTCHRQIIDGAMNCQFSDISTGEEKWAYNIGVGRKGQALACSVDPKGRCIIHSVEQRVREGGRKNTLNQIV